jgi:uncharacterized protein (TIGR03067 family)
MTMKYRLSAALLFAIVIPAAALRGQDPQQDLDKLQGTWTATAVEIDGNAGPKGQVEKLTVTVTFKGDKMIMAAFDAPNEGYTVTLDPSQKPKALDMTSLGGKRMGKASLGIYLLDGDELKICVPTEGGKERPSDFKSPEGSDLIVMTLKRSKTALRGDEPSALSWLEVRVGNFEKIGDSA